MRDFFVSASILGQRDGALAIVPLADDAHDSLLKQALHSPTDMKSWIDGLKATMGQQLETMSHHHQLTIDGLIAMQKGSSPEEVVEVMRRLKRPSYNELRMTL